MSYYSCFLNAQRTNKIVHLNRSAFHVDSAGWNRRLANSRKVWRDNCKFRGKSWQDRRPHSGSFGKSVQEDQGPSRTANRVVDLCSVDLCTSRNQSAFLHGNLSQVYLVGRKTSANYS